MNKNAGKIVSAKPKPSVNPLTCFIHLGIFVTSSTSFTKIIKNMLTALKTSIDCSRRGNRGLVLFSFTLCKTSTCFLSVVFINCLLHYTFQQNISMRLHRRHQKHFFYYKNHLKNSQHLTT